MRRKTEWKRPLWLVGFAIFLCANVGGNCVPNWSSTDRHARAAGAVSLLYNAVLARFLLNDLLSSYMVIGTMLIASGAVLIATLASNLHHRTALMSYSRPLRPPNFCRFATIFTFLFVGVLTVSHLAEWSLHTRVYRNSFPCDLRNRSIEAVIVYADDSRRRWSAPTLAPVAEVSESSSGIATPVLANRDKRNAIRLWGRVLSKCSLWAERRPPHTMPPLNSGKSHSQNTRPIHILLLLARSIPTRQTQRSGTTALWSQRIQQLAQTQKEPGRASLGAQRGEQRIDAETIRQTKLGLSRSVRWSQRNTVNACLLLAKSGVELLMLSFSDRINLDAGKAGYLSDTACCRSVAVVVPQQGVETRRSNLGCPLAFCIYNTSSIALASCTLISWEPCMVRFGRSRCVGTAVLLVEFGRSACTVTRTAVTMGSSATIPRYNLCYLHLHQIASRRASDADYEGMLVANGVVYRWTTPTTPQHLAPLLLFCRSQCLPTHKSRRSDATSIAASRQPQCSHFYLQPSHPQSAPVTRSTHKSEKRHPSRRTARHPDS